MSRVLDNVDMRIERTLSWLPSGKAFRCQYHNPRLEGRPGLLATILQQSKITARQLC